MCLLKSELTRERAHSSKRGKIILSARSGATTLVEEILALVSIRFEENQLRERLSVLPQLAAVAFAATCAVRLENTARSLNANERANEPLSRSVEGVVAYLGNGFPFDTLAVEEELAVVMPDEDSSPGLTAAVVEDAAAAMIYTLRAIREDDPQNVVWAARRAYETADREVLSALNVGSVGEFEEEYILQHPVVQTELQRQLRDLNAVFEVAGDVSVKLVAIVARARSENILR